MEDPQAGPTSAPANSPEHPFYVRWVTGDDGKVRWDRVVLALALTAVSGYLASRAQRWGSSASTVPLKARAYHAAGTFAHGQVARWQRLESFAKTGYEITTLE